jgi:hypothetical protein
MADLAVLLQDWKNIFVESDAALGRGGCQRRRSYSYENDKRLHTHLSVPQLSIFPQLREQLCGAGDSVIA